jgi:hypothetical protein
MARNTLKNRPWKNSQVMTKEIDFQEALVKAFYLLMGFFGLIGMDEEDIYNLFSKKQALNKWRCQTNY